ncbi:MAG: AraC family transcriptional regulator [Pseudomonadota bacterium]
MLVARSVNIDPYQQLGAAGISRSALLNPEIKLPADAVAGLLEASAALAGVPDFALRMAETRQLSNLGPLGMIAREEPTLRRALATMARNHFLHNEALFLLLEEAGGIALIKQEIMTGLTGELGQVMELVVGVLCRTLASFLGAGWEPRRVCFSHAAPRDLTTHRRLFGQHVDFKCDFDGIVCLSSELDTAMPAFDPAMARFTRQYVDSLNSQPGTSMVVQTRQLIVALLASGDCSIENVARHLGMSRRTLHRHLAGTGRPFMSLLEEVRADLAVRYLAGHKRPLSSVAALLGFSSLSAFSRWFKTSFGCSASAWRGRQGQP